MLHVKSAQERQGERVGASRLPLVRSIFPDDAVAVIYKPSRSAMTPGKARTRDWKLRFEPRSACAIEPLMGWTATEDTLSQVELSFACASRAARGCITSSMGSRTLGPMYGTSRNRILAGPPARQALRGRGGLNGSSGHSVPMPSAKACRRGVTRPPATLRPSPKGRGARRRWNWRAPRTSADRTRPVSMRSSTP